MRHKFILILVLWFYSLIGKSQINEMVIDSILAKKITISGFCLCRISLGDLRKLSTEFKKAEVEEMDLGKKCVGTDPRYEKGKGYYSEKYPGMIFQKDDENYISKIRLNRDYIGKLPDGISINLQNLLLKDVIKKYPELDTKWGSRDCSDYWAFSNDTLAFFVKIDENKIPRYPIDEEYYLNKPIEAIDLKISCYSLSHKENEAILFSRDEPLYFIDSMRVNTSVLISSDPKEFALISVYKDSNAINVAGKDAKNGAIYITTKLFARKYYWNYFKTKSKEYLRQIPDINNEANVVYILNNKIIMTNFEKDLFEINDNNFLDLTILNEGQLKKDCEIFNKTIGVSIRTK